MILIFKHTPPPCVLVTTFRIRYKLFLFILDVFIPLIISMIIFLDLGVRYNPAY